MSSEERLNRLEEFVKRLAIHGRRARNDLRTNVNALTDAQIRNEFLFNERFARLSAAQNRTDEQIRELRAAQKETDVAIRELAKSQKETDKRLRVLIDIVGRDQKSKR
ncbi:MAG TPA: hypothetical protein VFU37_14975 [Pyrinomonadaceae bacterium]|nr:hypothetical protein [Pyrinomonadaceae bacterium]